MRFIKSAGTAGQIDLGLIFGVIALVALAAGRFLPLLTLAPSCVFRGLFAIPCPTCGATRAVVSLGQGDFLPALHLNPLITVLLTTMVLFGLMSVLTTCRILPRFQVLLTEREREGVRISALVLLVVNWLFLLCTQ